jgi:hypothetical protein
MSNLLPLSAIKSLKQEYLLRLCFLFLFAFLFTVVLSIVSILPTLIAIRSEEKSVLTDINFLRVTLDRQRNVAPGFSVDEVGHFFKLMSFDRTRNMFSAVLRNISQYNSSEVVISRYNYVDNNENMVLVIDGIAQVRDDLVFLVDMLKHDKMFEHVSVPISQFANDRDVKFTITLTGARAKNKE